MRSDPRAPGEAPTVPGTAPLANPTVLTRTIPSDPSNSHDVGSREKSQSHRTDQGDSEIGGLGLLKEELLDVAIPPY
jgi:hypothetical protein